MKVLLETRHGYLDITFSALTLTVALLTLIVSTFI